MQGLKPGMMVKINVKTSNLSPAEPFTAKISRIDLYEPEIVYLERPGLGFASTYKSFKWALNYLMPCAPALAPVILTFEDYCNG